MHLFRVKHLAMHLVIVLQLVLLVIELWLELLITRELEITKVMQEYLIGMDQLGFSSIKILMEKHLVIYLDMMWLLTILVILLWLVVTETMVQVTMQVMLGHIKTTLVQLL